MVSHVLSAVMGVVPLVQENLRKEPLAEQVRTTALVSDTLVLTVTFEIGSAGEEKVEQKSELGS